MEIELDETGHEVWPTNEEVYFDDAKQEILTITRGGGGDLWKEEIIRDEREYFKRKLLGK